MTLGPLYGEERSVSMSAPVQKPRQTDFMPYTACSCGLGILTTLHDGVQSE